MATTRFNFIKRALDAIKIKDTIQTFHDTQIRGLKLIVRPTGVKTFVLYRKLSGKPERFTLGRYPDLTIEQARKKATDYNGQIAKGINPKVKIQSEKRAITFQSACEQYLEQYAKVHKKSWEEDEKQFRRYLSDWQTKKITHIRPEDIRKRHHDVGQRSGLYAANRLLSLIKGVFNRLIEWGWDQPNPAHGIKPYKEKSRDRFIQGDELPRFFKALFEYPNELVRDYILISLLTGARKTNVLKMCWSDVNLSEKVWRIPETKNGDAHTVPLVPEAVSILQRRKEQQKHPHWVFPGSGHGRRGHYADPQKAWREILNRSNIKNLRLHDLRRTTGSWQAATGASLAVIGKTLAHKNVATTAIYARLNLDPVRASMEKATSALLNAAQAEKWGLKATKLENTDMV